MANVHYGKIGDIWKHLPISEILLIEKPNYYWESHAGSEQYPLTHSMERDYGAFHFVEHLVESTILKASAFSCILNGLKQKDGSLTVYPGSPLIAMTLLHSNNSKYLFCDTDITSLMTIQQGAKKLGIPEDCVVCVQDDGISTLLKLASQLSADEARKTFVHIDPYKPFEESKSGFTALDLFCELSKRRVKAMLWYGYDSPETRNFCRNRISLSLKENKLSPSTYNLWSGEIYLLLITDPKFVINPGVRGCGILCSNLSKQATIVCSKLGKELPKIYRDAFFPTGHSGAIDFMNVPLF